MKKRDAVRELIHGRGFGLGLCPVLTALLIGGLLSVAHAAPEGGVVRAGSAQIMEQGGTTLIRQNSPRAIIDWRNFGIRSDERVQFAQPSSSSATLNRVTGDRVSVILGRMDANGQVLLINPNGILFGQGAQINVGSLIASTANISNDNFLQGRLVFDEPGKPGKGIINSGSITAAEGGLVALVAPHVRNDGWIQARLGKVVLGAADTFTIDLYGDGLVNFVLSEASLAELKDGQGQPVKNLISQTGTVDVGSGKAILVTAEAAKGVLDSLINMSGTVLADSAVKEGGRILLLARGGNADVSGHLSARGTTGGQIDVLGDQVHLSSTARLDVDGAYDGGTIHVGGAYQGSGDTYRAQTTQIEAGATLLANARVRGNGGEVVVWSNGETSYAGGIEARGGVEAGDGGLVEVSGKQSLLFNGLVDASANRGNAGSLLLDPYDFTIGRTEAALINRVLRTGTSTSVSADNDLFVNYAIDGRGRYAGGGLTLSAGHNLNVNDYIVTDNGVINLFAGSGMVSLLPGKAVYAGTAPITVRSGGTLTNAPYLTSGLLSLISTLGSVNIDQGIDSSVGNLLIQAAGDVNVNQPIVSLSDGNSVTVSAGNDINVNAQIDGRPALGSNPNGAVTMTAGRDIDLNKSILAGGINLTANLGTINAPTMTAGAVTLDANGIPHGEGLFAGTGPISVTAGGNLSNGVYVTTGPVSIRSTGGNVNVDTKLAEILGNVTIQSDVGSVRIDQEIANIRSGSNLSITAGTDINLNRQIDALDDSNPLSITPVPGGNVTFTAGNNVNLNRDLVTYNGPVNISATTGTLNMAWDNTDNRTYRIQTGSAPITVTTGGNLSTGTAPPTTFAAPDRSYLDPLNNEQKKDFLLNYIVDQLRPYVAFSTNGKLSLTSTGGDVTVDAPIPNTTGEISINAANAVVVNHKVFSNNQPITLTAGVGGITVNSTSDDYGILSQLSNLIPPINVFFGNSPAIDSGSGPLTLRAVGDVWITTANGIATKGKLIIDTRGKIVQGTVSNPATAYVPSEIELIADGGIDSFFAKHSPKISASSLNGDIHLAVYNPDKLDITANTGSVYAGGNLGADTTIYAGKDIILDPVNMELRYGVMQFTARRDVTFDYLYFVKSLDVIAGRDVNFNFTRGISQPSNFPSLWFEGGGLNVDAVGNISFNGDSAVYIGDTVAPYNRYGLTLKAQGNIDLRVLQTFGPVSIESTLATTPVINLWEPVGPHITPTINPPGDKGVASFTLIAPASSSSITMAGARAEGDVAINTGGTLTSSRNITSVSGNVLITASSQTIGAVDIGNQDALMQPGTVAPAVSPGPTVAPPGMPSALTALPAQPPDVVNVSGSGTPAASAAGAPEQIDPLRAIGTGGLSEIIPEESEDAGGEEGKKILKFSGGRGAGQEADFGRR